jgi:hypothetical protein
MKINVCTIDRNCEEGRQLIYWDTEDKLLHSELEPEDENGYPCETLEDAADMAWALWKNGWGFEWVTYSVKPEYLDNWAGDGPYETVALNVGEIGAMCRGWETTDYETIMNQLEEEG